MILPIDNKGDSLLLPRGGLRSTLGSGCFGFFRHEGVG